MILVVLGVSDRGRSGSGSILMVAVAVVKGISNEGTAYSTNSETTGGTEEHAGAAALLLLAAALAFVSVRVVAAVLGRVAAGSTVAWGAVRGRRAVSGGTSVAAGRRGRAITGRGRRRSVASVARGGRSVTAGRRRRAVARSATIARSAAIARSTSVTATMATKVARSIRGRGTGRRSVLAGSLPLGATGSYLDIVPALVLLVELGSPALRQRRLVGRRLVRRLRRSSVVLSGRRTSLAAFTVVAVGASAFGGRGRRSLGLRFVLLLVLVLITDSEVLELLGKLLEERHG